MKQNNGLKYKPKLFGINYSQGHIKIYKISYVTKYFIAIKCYKLKAIV